MLTRRQTSFSGEAPVDEADLEVNLNVTPMIDVLTCLLFFLLLSFGATVVALINSSVPALSDSSGEPETDKLKITITVAISEKGFSLGAQGEAVPAEETDKLAKTFPVTKDGYDFAALNAYALELKQKYKNSDSVILLPDADIPYAVLIKTMDATREKVENLEKKQVRTPLFPAAVVSSTVK
jgi:biopolymer transport protein ExbD